MSRIVCFTLEALTAVLFASIAVYEAHTQENASISLVVTPSKTKVVSGTPVAYLYNVSNTGETALTGQFMITRLEQSATLLTYSLAAGLVTT
jgi:hypothetical protein